MLAVRSQSDEISVMWFEDCVLITLIFGIPIRFSICSEVLISVLLPRVHGGPMWNPSAMFSNRTSHLRRTKSSSPKSRLPCKTSIASHSTLTDTFSTDPYF